MKPWLAVSVLIPCIALSSPAAPSGRPPVHSSFDLQVPVAPTPIRVAGASQLLYEVHLRSFAPDALTLERVEVVADGGDVLADFAGEALTARLGRPGSRASTVEPRTIAPGELAVLYLEFSLGGRTPPGTLHHRITCTSARSAEHAAITVEGAHTDLAREPPVVLGPPLRGGPWVAIHEPSWERGHRRMLYAVDGRARLPGRYAIDFIRLDPEGRYTRGDEDRIDHWYGYAAEVLAVADAVVASVRDDVAESTSVAAHPRHALADASGNYVALDLGNGRFAFYEHLKPGSVRVEPGQRVRRGQVLGALGFTGDSTGPHLHFHVADGSSPLGAEGLPYALQSFDVLGAYQNLEHFGRRPWTRSGEGAAVRRRRELPAPNSVVTFDATSDPPPRTGAGTP